MACGQLSEANMLPTVAAYGEMLNVGFNGARGGAEIARILVQTNDRDDFLIAAAAVLYCVQNEASLDDALATQFRQTPIFESLAKYCPAMYVRLVPTALWSNSGLQS